MGEIKNMKNEDFRRLLGKSSAQQNSSSSETKKSLPTSHKFTHKQSGSLGQSEKQKKKTYNKNPVNIYTEKSGDDIFEESSARLNEILKNYRDRAAERRKGLISDEGEQAPKQGETYNKVIRGNFFEHSSAEAKRIDIQKSKYLGGDMEHTHLVKGLDYSLLNKVRTEIQEQDFTEKGHIKDIYDPMGLDQDLNHSGVKLAKNICKVLFESKPPEKNDFFARGRMAYLVDLEDEEADVPSTLLRSVCDCPADQKIESINADNLLINKLTQVLSYLRADTKRKKKGYEKDRDDQKQQMGDRNETKIFEGLDEYVPAKKGGSRDREADNSNRKYRRKTYFDSSINMEGTDEQLRRREHRERAGQEDERKRLRQDDPKEPVTEVVDDNLQRIKKRRLEEEDAYAEFYPGGLGMLDAGGESDEDEADYTQMDMGNRKGPVKRWDFDTQEDYEKYQSSREAHPRAAYQFGVKTSSGRKTRKNNAAANERKLDKELEKINKIIEKGVSQNIRY